MKLTSSHCVLVTGAASGLGLATARRFASLGCKTLLFDMNVEAGQAAAQELGGVFFQTDVSDVDAVRDSVARGVEAVGCPRVVVNCAGIVLGQKTVRKDRDTGAFLAHSSDLFSKTIDVNLKGSFYVSSVAAEYMAGEAPLDGDGQRGVIVMTSSVAAEDGQIGQAAYGASKGGVKSLVLPMARDLSAYGIRVAAILPGIFHTPMVDGFSDELKASLSAQVPFPSRLGQPDEYAALAQHIVENDMINGCTIRLDGAIRMQPR